MLAKDVFGYFRDFDILNVVGLEDFADRTNSLLTVIVFLVCTLIVALNQYVLSPIICITPEELSALNINSYITSYCWAHGTISLTPNQSRFDRFPQDQEWIELDKTQRLTYYQYVPFVLCLQALLCFTPRLVWVLICNNIAGLNLNSVLRTASQSVSDSSPDQRKCQIRAIVQDLDCILLDRRRQTPASNCWWRFIHCQWFDGRRLTSAAAEMRRSLPQSRFGSFIRLQYLLLKMVYVGHILFELWLIQFFLGFSGLSFFSFVFKSFLAGAAEWSHHVNWFPRVTFCYPDNIKVVGGKVGLIAQCVLPQNMLNEKIYIFLWFWLIGTLSLTLFSSGLWFYRILMPSSRDAFGVRLLRSNLQHRQFRLLRLNSENKEVSEHSICAQFPIQDDWNLFLSNYLQKDGIFILMMIELNTTHILASCIARKLWKNYRKNGCLDKDRELRQFHLESQHRKNFHHFRESMDGTLSPHQEHLPQHELGTLGLRNRHDSQVCVDNRDPNKTLPTAPPYCSDTHTSPNSSLPPYYGFLMQSENV